MRINRNLIATYTVMAICTIVYFLSKVLGFSNSNSSEVAIMLGCYYKPFIMASEWWRLLTVGFVHMQLLHLFLNMTSLYVLGNLLEPRIGHLKFLLILFASVIGGSIWIFILDGNVVTVGLSGGLYGLMVCYIMIVVANGGMNHPVIRNSIIRTIMINLCMNFMPGVSYSGHIGGAITGLLFSMILVDEGLLKQYRRHACICTIIFSCFLGYMMKQKSYISPSEVYKGTDYHILQEYQSFGWNDYAQHISSNLDEIYGDQDLSAMLKGETNGQKIY